MLFSGQNGSEILTTGRDGGVHAGLRLVALRDRGADLSVRRSGRSAAVATGVVRVRALAATTPLQRRHPSAVDARPAAVGRRGHPCRQFDRQQDHREYALFGPDPKTTAEKVHPTALSASRTDHLRLVWPPFTKS